MKKKSDIQVPQGAIHNLKKDTGITDFAQAIDEAAESICCGVNCKCGYIELPNHVTGGGTSGTRVGYFKNGTWTTATKAVFEADKAANFA